MVAIYDDCNSLDALDKEKTIIMNFKQILKPDWRKILIFIVISILISLFPIYPCELEIHGVVSLPAFGVYPRTKLVPIFIGILSSIVGEDILSYQECGLSDETWWTSCKCNFLFSLPFSLIVIIVSYLLSCFLIWIYEKYRSKKK